jgi:protein TonB
MQVTGVKRVGCLKWAVFLSLIVHGVAGMAVVMVSALPKKRQPLVIDFTLQEPLRDDSASARKAAPRTARPARASLHTGFAPPRGNITRQVEVLPQSPPISRQPPPIAEAASIASTTLPAEQVIRKTGFTPSGFTDGNNTKIPAAPATATSMGSGTVLSATETQKHYLREHFSYIRDLIVQHLVYPQTARKMGWSGRVVVTFVITADGNVNSLRVLTSSGYQMLDRNAVETVRKTAPFPRPPVSAELVLPVEYTLE